MIILIVATEQAGFFVERTIWNRYEIFNITTRMDIASPRQSSYFARLWVNDAQGWLTNILEALHRTIQDLNGNDEVFGGAVLPLSGIADSPAILQLSKDITNVYVIVFMKR